MSNILFRKVLYFISILSVIVAVIMGISIPWSTKWYFNNVLGSDVPNFLVIFLGITVIPFLLILIQVMVLSKSLLDDNYLNSITINGLKNIRFLSAVECGLYIVATIATFHYFVFIVVIIAIFMIFILTSVIIELINKSIELKDENDLTI